MQQLAAAAATSTDPVSLLLVYGPLGVFAALLVGFTRTAITRERTEKDRAEAEVKALNDFIRSELLPKQVEAALLHKQVAEVLEQAIGLIGTRRDGRADQPPFGGRHGLQ